MLLVAYKHEIIKRLSNTSPKFLLPIELVYSQQVFHK